MTDDKNSENAGASADKNADAAQESAALAPAPKPTAPIPTPTTSTTTAQARASSGPIAWLALLLVLVVSAATIWSLMDGQRREAELLQRVRALESVSGQDTTTFDQMRDNLERKIELEVEAMQARQQRGGEDQQRALEEQQRSLSQQQQAISRLETVATEAADRTGRLLEAELDELDRRMQQQEQLIGELSTEDRKSWALAEAQYLLRLANQRLIMTGDTLSAEAMLRSADNIIREMDDADLYDLRAALAQDLAAVRAVPRLDTQGIYVRIDALIRQTNDLVMFELPTREMPEAMELGDDWQSRLQRGYEAAIEKLSEYIVVSRRDVPIEMLMDPQYEGLVRQNMRMLLEQAQVAMLSGNQLLYEQSLERADGWVSQFFKDDEQAAVAMAGELRQLAQERVAVELPDLGKSIAALEEVVRLRLSRGGN